MFEIKDVVDSYIGWLEVKAPDQRKQFLNRLASAPEAARAEAVTFGVLRLAYLRPRVAELVDKGGTDFLCEPKDRGPFAVEVTSLSVETVTRASGLSDPLPNGEALGFQQITRSLLREAVNKATQLAEYPMPRVLVLATEHSQASLLMNARSAQELLTGTTSFSIPIGEPDGEIKITTELKNSVFFRGKDDGSIEPARQSISAILLMTISDQSASLIGVLHPQPAFPFDPAYLERVHFAKLRSWPLERGIPFGIDWVGPLPSATLIPHWPINLEEWELREQ